MYRNQQVVQTALLGQLEGADCVFAQLTQGDPKPGQSAPWLLAAYPADHPHGPVLDSWIDAHCTPPPGPPRLRDDVESTAAAPQEAPF